LKTDGGLGATQAAAGILAPHIEVSSPTPFLELAVRSLKPDDSSRARKPTRHSG